MNSTTVKVHSLNEIHSLLFDLMTDGALIVDQTGGIVDCNETFHKRLGYAKNEVVGKNVAEIDSPEYAARVGERIKQIIDNGQAVFDTAHYRKDGSIMPVEISARPIEINGELHFVCIVRDITERKKMDRALRERERMYRAVVETSADGFWAANAKGEIIEVNDAYCKRSGYSREELLNMRIPDVEAIESPEETRAHIEKIIREGHDRFETQHRTKSGEIWPVEIVTTFWPFDGGVFLVFNVDITERKKAEAELNKLSQAIEQAGEGVMITDTEGIIEYVNPAFSTITGYSPQDAIGQRTSILKSDAQDPEIYTKLWSTITQGEIWEGTLIDKRKDGSFYPAMVSIAPVFNSSNEIIHYVSIQKDMTELKRMEHQVLQAQKMEAMGTLVGGIAHDFNNMLAALQGNVFLALNEIHDTACVRDKLETIERLSENAAMVVRQLLTFAKKDIVEMAPVALNNLILEGFKLAKSTIPENIRHHLDICDEVLIANADVTQLQQAMINLSNNARDAVIDTKHPEIVWSLQKYVATDEFYSKHPEIRHGQFARISVRDNGYGIKETHIRAIFDPFFTTKEPGKGTGLGLAMVFGSVERHSGVVEVESSPGEGTTFHLYLPLTTSIESVSETESRPLQIPAPGKGETILLVDDEESLRQVTAQVLSKMGYNIIEAADGEEALKIFRERRNDIDLVLTDVIMPEMGGVELAREIHSLHHTMPIIFATGYDRDEVTQSNLQLDNSQVISKPFPYDTLGQLIVHLMQKTH